MEILTFHEISRIDVVFIVKRLMKDFGCYATVFASYPRFITIKKKKGK